MYDERRCSQSVKQFGWLVYDQETFVIAEKEFRTTGPEHQVGKPSARRVVAYGKGDKFTQFQRVRNGIQCM
jgi:hypothetical protein